MSDEVITIVSGVFKKNNQDVFWTITDPEKTFEQNLKGSCG